MRGKGRKLVKDARHEKIKKEEGVKERNTQGIEKGINVKREIKRKDIKKRSREEGKGNVDKANKTNTKRQLSKSETKKIVRRKEERHNDGGSRQEMDDRQKIRDKSEERLERDDGG